MRKNGTRSAALLAVGFAALALAGCGSDKKSEIAFTDTSGGAALVSEAACGACHGSSVSSKTGSPIYADYIASAHNTVPNAAAHYPNGVGCQGCHGGGAQHNGVGPLPYPDPSSAGVCFTCHKNYLDEAHYRNYTTNAGTRPAMYASKKFQTDCTACHDPHKADQGITQEHRDWAKSKHGDVNGVAWANRDFKANADCIRCHTTTGYVNYVQSNFTLPTATWAEPGDYTREVLTCKGCHTSYDFKNRVRTVGKFTAPYSNGASIEYPDARKSNLCLVCHTGRVSGESIKNSTDSDGKLSFMNSHYLTAGAIVFAKGGYHFYSSASRLGTRDYALSNSDDHHKIGLQTTGFNRTFNEAADHTSGPCIGCHLTSGDGSHTFSPFTETGVTTPGKVALNPMCGNACHSGRTPGGADDNSANTWFGKDVTEADLVAGVSHATHKGRLLGALEALRAQLEKRGIYFKDAYPYFYQADLKTSFTDWESVASALGVGLASDPTGTGWKNVMGAAFNYNLIKHDPGAVAHNRRYSRRLIYDSIDFLDDGVMNRSVSATLNALPDTTVYKASALNYISTRP